MGKKATTVAVLLATLAFFAAEALAQTAMKVNIDDDAPEFTLNEFSTGQPISLSDYKGKKVVLIEFWATWCDICKAEMPTLVKDYKALKDKGFEMLAVVLSRGDPKDRGKIQALVDKYKVTYPILMDTEYEVATKVYGLSGPIPLKVIVDCNGKVRYSHVGDFPDGVSEVPFVVEDILGEGSCSN